MALPEKPKTEDLSRAREYSTGFSRDLAFILAINAACGGGLIGLGLYYNKLWVMKSRGTPFIIIGACILVFLIPIVLSILKKTIVVISSAQVRCYQQAGPAITKDTVIAFERMKEFYPSPRSRLLFRSTVVGDGTNKIVIQSFAFPAYDEMVERIATIRRKTYRVEGSDRHVIREG